jgi:hypothetical protein
VNGFTRQLNGGDNIRVATTEQPDAQQRTIFATIILVIHCGQPDTPIAETLLKVAA